MAQLAAGCESELEIWGHLRVFERARASTTAYASSALHAGGRRFRLDLAFVPERVAVEMDGDR